MTEGNDARNIIVNIRRRRNLYYESGFASQPTPVTLSYRAPSPPYPPLPWKSFLSHLLTASFAYGINARLPERDREGTRRLADGCHLVMEARRLERPSDWLSAGRDTAGASRARSRQRSSLVGGVARSSFVEGRGSGRRP